MTALPEIDIQTLRLVMPNVHYPTAPEQPGNAPNSKVDAPNWKLFATSKNIPATLKKPESVALREQGDGSIDGYKGEVRKDDKKIREGKGKQTYTNGTVEDGFFENDQFIKGKFIDAEGNLIQGAFIKGSSHGKDIKMELQNGLTYNGEFEEGKISGKGIMMWQTNDPKVQIASTFGVFNCNYTGQFKDCCFSLGALTISTVKNVQLTKINGQFNTPLSGEAESLNLTSKKKSAGPLNNDNNEESKTQQPTKNVSPTKKDPNSTPQKKNNLEEINAEPQDKNIDLAKTAELETKLGEFQSKNNDLKNQVDAQTKDIQNHAKEMATLKETLAKSSSNQTALKETHASELSQKEIDVKSQAKVTLEKELAALKKIHQKEKEDQKSVLAKTHSIELIAAQKATESVLIEKNALDTNQQNLKNQNDQLKKDQEKQAEKHKEILTKEVSKATEGSQRSMKELKDTHKTLIDEIQGKLTEQTLECTKLKSKATEESQRSIEKLKDTHKTLIDEIQGKLTEQTHECTKLKKDSNSSNNEIKQKLEKEATEKDTKIKTLLAEIEVKNASIKANESSTKDLQKANIALEDNKSEIQRLSADAQVNDKLKIQYKETDSQLKERVKELNAELTKKDEAIKEAKDAKEKLVKMGSDLATSKDSIAVFNKESEADKKIIADLTKDLEEKLKIGISNIEKAHAEELSLKKESHDAIATKLDLLQNQQKSKPAEDQVSKKELDALRKEKQIIEDNLKKSEDKCSKSISSEKDTQKKLKDYEAKSKRAQDKVKKESEESEERVLRISKKEQDLKKQEIHLSEQSTRLDNEKRKLESLGQDQKKITYDIKTRQVQQNQDQERQNAQLDEINKKTSDFGQKISELQKFKQRLDKQEQELNAKLIASNTSIKSIEKKCADQLSEERSKRITCQHDMKEKHKSQLRTARNSINWPIQMALTASAMLMTLIIVEIIKSSHQ